jgi:hypothetical protein
MEVSEPYVSLSISEEGGRLGLKCLLLSYFRVGDNSGAISRVATAASLRPGRPLMAGTCDTFAQLFWRLPQRFQHEFHSES